MMLKHIFQYTNLLYLSKHQHNLHRILTKGQNIHRLYIFHIHQDMDSHLLYKNHLFYEYRL